ncbi:MAG: hemoglobin [Planctomycetota bacterium]|jgi:hemoglobin
MTSQAKDFGDGDTSYQAAGGLEGIQQLVDHFYDLMDSLPETETIRLLHKKDLGDARKKLTYFLSGWLGGPKLYQQHIGSISIPGFHRKFDIGSAEKNAWLSCMDIAIAKQDYSDEFKAYLLYQLSIPAERSRIRD